MTDDKSNDWSPISESDLTQMLIDESPRHNPVAERLWGMVRIKPVKWQLHPWGDLGGGFWVVGILGSTVIWYNDIEDGFNTSRWTTPGLIDDYFCDQNDLRFVLASLADTVCDGADMPARLGPPHPGEYGD